MSCASSCNGVRIIDPDPDTLTPDTIIYEVLLYPFYQMRREELLGC